MYSSKGVTRNEIHQLELSFVELAFLATFFFHLKAQGLDQVLGVPGEQVSTGTCGVLMGGLQDFPSPSTSRRAPKKTKASVIISHEGN